MTDTTQENLVKRLDLQYGGQDVWMGEDPDGDYVSFEDYAALKAKLAAERERCAKVAESRWRSWGQNDPHGPVECDVTACENIAAAIRKGDTP
jgi:hypothetical protein